MDSLTEEEFDTLLPNEEALRSFTVGPLINGFRFDGRQVCGPSNAIAQVTGTSSDGYAAVYWTPVYGIRSRHRTN